MARIRREPGAFFVQGAPLAFVESAGAVDDAFRTKLLDTCAIGRDRSLWQDAEFAL